MKMWFVSVGNCGDHSGVVLAETAQDAAHVWGVHHGETEFTDCPVVVKPLDDTLSLARDWLAVSGANGHVLTENGGQAFFGDFIAVKADDPAHDNDNNPDYYKDNNPDYD